MLDLDAPDWLNKNVGEWLGDLAVIGAWQIGADERLVTDTLDALIAELRASRKVVEAAQNHRHWQWDDNMGCAICAALAELSLLNVRSEEENDGAS